MSREEIIEGATEDLDEEEIQFTASVLNPIIDRHDDENDGLDIEEFINMAQEQIPD